VHESITVDGRTLLVRPVNLGDVERLARLFSRLSPQTVLFRFFRPLTKLTPMELVRLAGVDHRRREALVVLDDDEIVAVARYDAYQGCCDAELAITVEDAWHRRGIGRELTARLTLLAIERGFDTFRANILAVNRPALALVRSIARDAHISCSHGECEATIPLTHAG
jgi:GNAT superfamily N-acetyltransferase